MDDKVFIFNATYKIFNIGIPFFNYLEKYISSKCLIRYCIIIIIPIEE